MAAVTQNNSNYIGGVLPILRRLDERQVPPGQVTEATNVYIDPTLSLELSTSC